jgi:hypothetical protein
MAGVFVTAATGWLLVGLLAATIAAPYLLRRLAGTAGNARGLRPHFWLGFTVPALTMVHAWPAMSGGWISTTNTGGIYLATATFLLVIGQVMLGNALRTARTGRRWLRRLHLAVMVTLIAGTIGHVLLNGAVLPRLLG